MSDGDRFTHSSDRADALIRAQRQLEQSRSADASAQDRHARAVGEREVAIRKACDTQAEQTVTKVLESELSPQGKGIVLNALERDARHGAPESAKSEIDRRAIIRAFVPDAALAARAISDRCFADAHSVPRDAKVKPSATPNQGQPMDSDKGARPPR